MNNNYNQDSFIMLHSRDCEQIIECLKAYNDVLNVSYTAMKLKKASQTNLETVVKMQDTVKRLSNKLNRLLEE